MSGVAAPKAHQSGKLVDVAWVQKRLRERGIARSREVIYRMLQSGRLRGKRLPPRGWYKIEYDSVVELLNEIENC